MNDNTDKIAAPAGYRIMPVELLPAIKDAIVETGKCSQPETLWAAVIAAFDLVAPAAQSGGASAMPAEFGNWFKANYPADTLIHDPEWHAPKIYWRAIRAAAPERSETPADENRYARELASALWEKHYKADAPHWQVLPDTFGALSQIDNMTTGLSRPAPAGSSSAAPSDLSKQLRAVYVAYNGHGEEIKGIFDQAADELDRLATPSVQAVAAPGQEQPTELTADLIDLLNAIRPEFGAVGSRDVDVAAQRRRIDSAIVSLGLIMAHAGREHPTPLAASPVELTDAEILESATPFFKENFSRNQETLEIYCKSVRAVIERHLSGDTAAQGGE